MEDRINLSFATEFFEFVAQVFRGGETDGPDVPVLQRFLGSCRTGAAQGDHQVPRLGKCAGKSGAEFTRRAVADQAHRVERFLGRADGDEGFHGKVGPQDHR